MRFTISHSYTACTPILSSAQESECSFKLQEEFRMFSCHPRHYHHFACPPPLSWRRPRTTAGGDTTASPWTTENENNKWSFGDFHFRSLLIILTPDFFDQIADQNQKDLSILYLELDFRVLRRWGGVRGRRRCRGGRRISRSSIWKRIVRGRGREIWMAVPESSATTVVAIICKLL